MIHLTYEQEYRKDVLGKCPAEVRPIVRVLLDYEDRLSDGFGYYCSAWGVAETLSEIAHKIMALKQEVTS